MTVLDCDRCSDRMYVNGARVGQGGRHRLPARKKPSDGVLSPRARRGDVAAMDHRTPSWKRSQPPGFIVPMQPALVAACRAGRTGSTS